MRLVGHTKRGRDKWRREEALKRERYAASVVAGLDMVLFQRERLVRAETAAKVDLMRAESEALTSQEIAKQMQRMVALTTAQMERRQKAEEDDDGD